MPTMQMITDALHRHEGELRTMHVKSLDIFGSSVRGEAGPGSDVDFLVEFDPDGRVGLIHFLRVKEYLSVVLGGVEVDLATREALHPAMREQILAEKKHVF